MKLQRIYHKLEASHLALKTLPGGDWRGLYDEEHPDYNREATISDVTFGFSYVADMKIRPYWGKHKDCYAAIDLYSDNKYVMGIPIYGIQYIKDSLSLKTDIYAHRFIGGYKEGAKCTSEGRIAIDLYPKESIGRKYDSQIIFHFKHQSGYELILRLDMAELPRLIDAFSACEREWNTFMNTKL